MPSAHTILSNSHAILRQAATNEGLTAQRVDLLAKFTRLTWVELETNEVCPVQGPVLMTTMPCDHPSFILGIPCPTFSTWILLLSLAFESLC